jgi:hypothetical protein
MYMTAAGRMISNQDWATTACEPLPSGIKASHANKDSGLLDRSQLQRTPGTPNYPARHLLLSGAAREPECSRGTSTCEYPALKTNKLIYEIPAGNDHDKQPKSMLQCSFERSNVVGPDLETLLGKF